MNVNIFINYIGIKTFRKNELLCHFFIAECLISQLQLCEARQSIFPCKHFFIQVLIGFGLVSRVELHCNFKKSAILAKVLMI